MTAKSAAASSGVSEDDVSEDDVSEDASFRFGPPTTPRTNHASSRHPTAPFARHKSHAARRDAAGPGRARAASANVVTASTNRARFASVANRARAADASRDADPVLTRVPTARHASP